MSNLNNPITELISQLPVTQYGYDADGGELKVKCVASAKVNTEELIKVFGEIKRFLPLVRTEDVRSDIVHYTPGSTGEITVRWQAFTEQGRDYLREIAQAIAKIYQNKLDYDSKKTETRPLSLENKRNAE